MLSTKTLDRLRELTKTGKRQKDIAKALNAEGHKTKTGRPFTQATVSQASVNLLGVRKVKGYTKGRTKPVQTKAKAKATVSLDTALLEIATMKLPDAYKLACLRAITELE